MVIQVQWNNTRIVLCVIGAALGVYLVYTVWLKGSGPFNMNQATLTQFGTWKTHPWEEIPKEVKSDMRKVEIKEGTETFKFQGKAISIYSREVSSKSKSKVPVLLLHGMAFSSENWKEIGTMNLLGAMGHRVIAIDLPGYGKSKDSKVDNKAEFLATFIQRHELHRPVIVSPSMSGGFSLPYIMSDPTTALDRVQGFIPVAPVSTEAYSEAQYKQCHVPTMIVYGSKDTKIGLTSKNNLSNLPDSEVFPIDGAGHPAYIDKQDAWHINLYNFMLAIERVKE